MSRSADVTLLLVEDDPTDAAFVERMLVEHRGGFASGNPEGAPEIGAIEHVETLSDAIDRGSDVAIDIILLDLGLPDSRGLETLTTMREYAPTKPIIVLTGETGHGVEAIQHGAQEYLVKGRITADVLRRTITYSIERARISRELHDRSHRLEVINAILRADLRTDLSMIVGRADQLHDQVDDRDRPAVDEILTASNHLLDVTDTVATAVDVIADDGQRPPQSCDLRTIVAAVLDRWDRSDPGTVEVVWRPDDTESVTVVGTPMLETVLEYLLQSAQRRTAGDTALTVTVETTDDGTSLSVADRGAAMSDIRKRQLLAHGERELSGSEVGAKWYFVSTVLESIDAELSVEENDPRGTVVTVHFDRIDPETAQ